MAALLCHAVPALASREGAAIGEGLRTLLLAVAAVLTLLIGVVVGVWVARQRRLSVVRTVLVSLGWTLLVDAVLVAMAFWMNHIASDMSVERDRQLRVFREQSKAAIANMQPGELDAVVQALLGPMTRRQRNDMRFVVADHLNERLVWSPSGWTAADCAALVALAGQRFADDPRGAQRLLALAVGIDWLNGRQSARPLCAGEWASTCLHDAWWVVETACYRQRGAAHAPLACSPDMQRRAQAGFGQ